MTAPSGDRPAVLHVLEALEGGTARHLIDLVRHADGIRHEVAIPKRRSFGVTDDEAADAIVAAGGRIHWVDMQRSPVHPRNARAVVALRHVAREVTPAIIHGHSSIGGALARVMAWRWKTPVVYTPNGIAQGRAARLIERGLSRRTDCFVAVSPSEGDLAVELRLTTRDALAVIPNGIDLDPPPPLDPPLRTRLGIGDAPFVGTISRLIAQKAPEHFVDACAAIAERDLAVQFALIGSGPLEAEVRARIEKHGIGDRLHLIGALEGAARAAGEFDVFLLTSRFEGGPYAPLEAMRAGAAVVVSDAVGSRDAVEDGVSGRVLPLAPATGWADAAIELIRDRVRRDAFVAAAHGRLADRFDVRSMGAATAALYRRLL